MFCKIEKIEDFQVSLSPLELAPLELAILELALLELAASRGKGVLGMKIFGGGGLVKEEERSESLKFVVNSRKVHAMTIGCEDATQVHDTVDRLMGFVHQLK